MDVSSRHDGLAAGASYTYHSDGTLASYATWGGWGYDATTGQLSGVSTPEGFLMETYDPATGQPTGVSGAFSTDTQRDTLGRITTVTGTPPNVREFVPVF